MFAKSVIALATVASFAVAAPVEKRGAPAGWAYGYLEDYDTYHLRYLALDCQDKHNTTFFDDCCHPLLATEKLSSRPDYCTPSKAEVSAVAASIAAASATPSATVSADTESESEYCDTEASASAAGVTPIAASPTATTAKAATPAAASPSATTTSPANEEHYVAPSSSSTTTTKAAYTPAATTQAAATTSAASSSSNSGTNTGGYATYFYQGGQAGACGTVHGDYDMIVAIDQDRWGGSFGQASGTCGKWLTITNTNNGKTVTAMVADVCPTCANGNSLDLSVGAFTAIASESDGEVPISWYFD